MLDEKKGMGLLVVSLVRSGEGLFNMLVDIQGVNIKYKNSVSVTNLFVSSDWGCPMFGEIPKNKPCGRLAVVEMPKGEYEFYAWHGSQSKYVKIKSVKKFSKKFNINAGEATYIGNIHFIISRKEAGKSFLGIPVTKLTVDIETRNMQDRDLSIFYKKYPNIENEKVQIKIIHESSPVQLFGASKHYPPIPEDLNINGYFKIPKSIIERNKITKVITNVFIYEDNGKLTKRNRQHVLTYNNGDLTSSSGNKDQSGDVSYKYIYDKKRNLIEEYRYQGLNITVEPYVKIFYKNIGNKLVSKEVFNNEGVSIGRETFKYDKNNNNSEISIFVTNNQLRLKIIKKYDVFNNLIMREKSNITTYYSYRDNTVTMSVKLPDGTIQSSHKYTFNKNNTIDSYLRTSGDGGYWDKYVYSYNENGLPISKVHSKKEFIIQDPYELTKYEYVK